MKKYLISRVIIIVFLCTFMFSIFYYTLTKSNNSLKWGNTPFFSVIEIVNKTINLPLETINRLSSNMNDLLDTYKENQSLKKAVIELENQTFRIAELEEENKNLKLSLNELSSLDLKDKVTVKISSRSTTSWYSFLKVEIPKNSNMKVNDLALANGGVVGKIVSIQAGIAKIALLTDVKEVQNIPVKINTSEKDIFALVTGFDKVKNHVILEQLSSNEKIEKGAIVKTSGLDGITRSDLPLGEVVMAENSSDSLSRKIYVRAKADFNQIDYVTVVGR